MKAHKDQDLLDFTLTVIPVEAIHEETQSRIEKEGIPFNHALTKALLKWFKHSFFKWVDKPQCECGQAGQIVGTDRPNQSESIDPKSLLLSRKGRCGEWANAFTLVCRAMGLEVRYVLDFTDHVWTEIYCDVQNRWIHCDSCEESFDSPLLYSEGWGKKLNYVFAVGDTEVRDVTRKYVKDFKECSSRRNMCAERLVNNTAYFLTSKLRSSLSPLYVNELNLRDFKEIQALFSQQINWGELKGRQTGSVEWRTARGEMGK
ncbi:hypothetical protein HK103_003794 [Boothiomyces macroporosus]|uniref:Transglutaminase-like domain-containing protein n=1 Tax=Boothiomyces macroporosus TaxID=261099 RepID=A0AAD5Y4F3_9FUNG|nr:hypothetical protein HK103_003794 [Boothiomyces macroporosus]